MLAYDKSSNFANTVSGTEQDCYKAGVCYIMLKKHLPEAQIDFDWDRSEAMKTANADNDYEMD